MQPFKASYLNEMEKIYRKKKAIVLAIISVVVIVLGQLIVTGIRSNFGIKTVNGTNFSLLVLSVFLYTVLPLFTALISIDIFAGEFSHNTMKITFSRPVSRFKLFSAKVAAIMTFIFANLFVVLVLSLLTGLIFNSFNITFSELYRVVISYFVTVIPVTILALMIVLLSNIFKSGTIVFFISILLFIIIKTLEVVFPAYSSLFITSMFGWNNLWIAQSVPVLKILREFLIMLGYGIMLFTGGYYLFDSKNV